ncbi:hypothetical protein [Xanthobacter tagetidis]|uniref:Uncharacterized protein n=1 Tax=Xanthobacter tagetidis TaxID=60216 RepID=A0A3L7A2E3_9HYPH|nr:hypothetical protein [Xanthobacter tagetidis]MBB6309268.1 hypothetical protein [Xanthobacter tagetidis]RLP74224.1 hypothetical protein D9R14_19395 [Xanthobacter tagetidis]
MKLSKSLALRLALAALFSVAIASEAAAWTRSGTVTTPRGTYTGSGCAAGVCARTASVTRPHGNSVSRSGSVARTSYPSYMYSRTTTGSYGRSVTRSGSVVVYP